MKLFGFNLFEANDDLWEEETETPEEEQTETKQNYVVVNAEEWEKYAATSVAETPSQAEEDYQLAREAEKRAMARAREMQLYEADLARKAEEALKIQMEEDIALATLEKSVAMLEGVEAVAAKREAKAEAKYLAEMKYIRERAQENADKRAKLRAKLSK